MEKVYFIKDIDEINKFQDADAFLIETEFSGYFQYPKKDEELENIISKIKSINKKIYLRCDRILLENEIENLLEKVSLFKKSDGIFFEDFSFVKIFAKRNNEFKLIYFPFEGISSIEEAEVLLECGIDKVVLPHGKEELMQKENNYSNIGISYLYKDVLFMSRRKLLSLKDIDSENKHRLQENTRETTQRIIQTEVGTIIYDEIKHIENIHKDVDILLCDRILIED